MADIQPNSRIRRFEKSIRRDIKKEVKKEEVTVVGTMEDIPSRFWYLLSILFIFLLILVFIIRSLEIHRLNMLLIPIAALIGFILLIRVLAILSNIPSNSRTRRSGRPSKRVVTEVMEKEIQCAFCGEKLRITANMKHCPGCGTEIPQCMVCLLPIVHGDDFVKCPYCGSFAHRPHLVEWVKVKGRCPYCKERLTEFDIPL